MTPKEERYCQCEKPRSFVLPKNKQVLAKTACASCKYPNKEERACTCASFYTVRGKHKEDCPAHTPEPQQTWEQEFLRTHYEPEHLKGGVCWCGVTYLKREDGKMEIVHKEQRDILKSFIEKELTTARADEQLRIEKIVEGMRKHRHDTIYGAYSVEDALRVVDCSATEASCYNAALTDILAAIRVNK